MRAGKRTRNLVASGVLLVGLVGALILNLVIAVDLPSRVYTQKQLAYLDYNRSRSISQAAPTWNLVGAEGDIQPLTLSYVRENRVRASLYARYEEQDGVSVTVYDLEFRGEYRLVYDGPAGTFVELFFPFPANLETLHEVRLLVDGEEPQGVQYSTGGIYWQANLREGEERQVQISYQADGASSFAYRLSHGQRSDVDVVITVVGLAGSTVPKSSLPTSSGEITGDSETLTWDYTGLIVDRDVQLRLPSRLSFAQRIASLQDDFRVLAGLAPFLVAGFLVSLAAVCRFGQVRLGLESYLLAGCGLALFFPLLIFASGLVGLGPAAIVALLLVSGLELVFLGLSAGWQKTRWRVGLLLIVFLGFFALGVLSPWQGLLLTCGGVLLVGTFMLLYARRPVRAEPDPQSELEAVASAADLTLLPGMVAPAPEPAPPAVEMSPKAERAPEAAPTALDDEVGVDAPDLHCPFCARALDDDYGFCPGCGHDTNHCRRCRACATWQFVPADLDEVHCMHCGEALG